VEELNRDLSFGTWEKSTDTPWLASYAVLFTDLGRDLYYLQGDWSSLAGEVTFFTPEQAKPLFPNMWCCRSAGPRRRPEADLIASRRNSQPVFIEREISFRIATAMLDTNSNIIASRSVDTVASRENI